MALRSHSRRTHTTKRSTQSSVTSDQAWLLVEALAAHFLKLDESDRASFPIKLETHDPAVVVSKVVEVLVRRLAEGKTEPQVLVVFGNRILLAFFSVFLQTHSAAKQGRILRAVAQLVPSLERDARVAMSCELAFWSRSAVGRSATTKIAEAIASVRRSLQVDMGTLSSR